MKGIRLIQKLRLSVWVKVQKTLSAIFADR